MSQAKKIYKDRNLQIVFGVTLMAVLGVSSITPAFPKIVEELNISNTDVGMLIIAFTLPGVILTPFAGILADRFGRKRILVPSLFLFGLAGGACALVGEFDTLIALRVVQGIGAASLGSINLTILGDMFSGRQRAAAMGLNASVLSTGVAAYPLLGGALATFGWNYPFFLPLVAIPIGILVLHRLSNPEPRNKESLREYLGSAWSYLRDIKVASAFTAGVVFFLILYGPYLTYFSLYLGTSFRASPFIIGLILSSTAITSALVSSQMGGIVKLISVTNLVKLGFAIQAVSLAILPFMPRLELTLISTLILGLSSGVMVPGLQTYVAGLAPSEYRAAFMSINTTMLRLGQTLGPLLFGLAYTYTNFEGTFLYGAGLALATAIIGFIGGKIIQK
ncbi:MFS transporter [Chloroflexota bacterium]